MSLIDEMTEQWGGTFQALSFDEKVLLLNRVSFEIWKLGGLIDDEHEFLSDATSRLNELTPRELLDLSACIANQIKEYYTP